MALGNLAASAAAAILAALLLFQSTPSPARNQEQLARHRNLGKAFFENPTTQKEAVAEFRKALDLAPDSVRDRLNYALALLAAGSAKEAIAQLETVQKQDPELPHSWFNLGIQYKKLGDYERAARQLEGMVALVPDEPVSHYNLGTLHKIAGRNEEAVREFELASRLDPNLAAPHFQLFNLYRQMERGEESRRRLELFQQMKKQQEGAAVPEDVEWSYYSEIYEPIDDAAATADSAPAPPIQFAAATLGSGITGRLTLLDFDADSRVDLLALSPGGARLFRSGTTAVNDGALAAVNNPSGAAAGDFNNDGYPDVCLLTGQGPVLLVNQKGKFTRHPLDAPRGSYSTVLWFDYDHDYDLDLLLLGSSAALMRNQGEAGFTEQTDAFPFVSAPAVSAATLRLIPDSKATDLLVTYSDRSAVLYRDRLGAKFEAQTVDAFPAGARLLQVIDADSNGALDVLYESGGNAFLALNRDGRFTIHSTPAPAPAILADVENRGIFDLVSGSGAVFRNLGGGRFDAARKASGIDPVTSLVASDFNADGKLDLAGVARQGGVRVFTNRTEANNRWLRVALTGVKNGKLALGAEVEVKAGVRYQKQVYEGVPLHFGLRSYAEADTVRITWPNGLIQSEAKQPSNRASVYQEAQRLSGSCPQVWTWNGREFVYVTDVLGVAPLGASAGDGTYFPVDSLEHIQIPAGALQPRAGRYEIRLTEELAETAYIDKVSLIAVDHPRGTSVFTNEKFQSPPYPALRLHTVGHRVYAASRRDKPPRRDKPRSVEFEFPADSAAIPAPLLVLSGWVDWADGSTFLGKAQEGRPLLPPALSVRDRDEGWRTLIDDIGLPAGKPKSIVVELPRGFTAIRISTDIAVHWTGAFLAARAAADVRSVAVDAEQASLRFRGFSRARIDPERKQPEMFFYPNPLPASMWNPTPGLYTRYGDVSPLTAAADDRFVIMGSGDELSLSWRAAAFPPIPPGHDRSFVLAVTGWAKDRDPNTAYSQTVEPLPFRAMSAYPYAAGERFPDTESHREWRRQYNTRPALRLLRPLAERRRYN